MPSNASMCRISAKRRWLDMDEPILTAISAVGFPIVVTFYLLTTFQKSLDRLTTQLGELTHELQRH